MQRKRQQPPCLPSFGFEFRVISGFDFPEVETVQRDSAIRAVLMVIIPDSQLQNIHSCLTGPTAQVRQDRPENFSDLVAQDAQIHAMHPVQFYH